MQKLITKYGLAAHLALSAVAPLFLIPYVATDTVAKVMIYLACLTFAWFLGAPSRLRGENSYMARKRVFKATYTDPLVWIMLAIILFSSVRYFNAGIDLAYDAENYVWYMTEATASFLPASHGEGAFLPLVTSFAALIMIVVSFHALGRGARYGFLYSVGLFGGVSAFVHIYNYSIGVAKLLEYAKCAFDCEFFLGFGYMLTSAFLVAALPIAFERRWNVAIVTIPLMLGAQIAAIAIFSPINVFVVGLAVLLLIVVYSVFWGRKSLSRSGELKLSVVFFVSLALAFMLIYFTDWKNFVAGATSLAQGFVDAEYRQVSDKLSSVAFKVWRDNIWLGTGVDTFAFDIRFNLNDADWLVIAQDQKVPLNAWWYLLAERGVIGALLIVVPVFFMLYAYFSRMCAALRKLPTPVVLLGPLVLIAAVALAFFNCSIFGAGMMPLLIAAVLVSAASFVKEKKDGE